MDEAITILRKKGMAQVAKKAGRAMKEGLVGVRLNADATDGVVAEVNCETDFVARTPEFQALVDDRHRRPARRAVDRGSAGARRGRRRGRPEGGREDRQDRREHGDHRAPRASPAKAWSAATCTSAARSACSSSCRACPPAARQSDGVADARARAGHADRRGEPVLRHARGSAGLGRSSRRRTSTAPRWRTAASRPT